MGTVYYLARQSDHALFDLGKAYAFADRLRAGRHNLDEYPVRLDMSPTELAAILIDDRMCFDAEIAAASAIRMIRFARDEALLLTYDERLCDGDEYRNADGELRVVDSRFPEDWARQLTRNVTT